MTAGDEKSSTNIPRKEKMGVPPAFKGRIMGLIHPATFETQLVGAAKARQSLHARANLRFSAFKVFVTPDPIVTENIPAPAVMNKVVSERRGEEG